jgi:hypothetical protein
MQAGWSMVYCTPKGGGGMQSQSCKGSVGPADRKCKIKCNWTWKAKPIVKSDVHGSKRETEDNISSSIREAGTTTQYTPSDEVDAIPETREDSSSDNGYYRSRSSNSRGRHTAQAKRHLLDWPPTPPARSCRDQSPERLGHMSVQDRRL